MNKKILIATAIISTLTTSAFASQFKALKAPSTAAVAKAYNTMGEIDKSYLGVYKITAKTNKPGRTEEQAHIAAIKESMHKYMCSFFDEAINITRDTNDAKGVDQVIKDLDLENNDIAKEKIEALRGALVTAAKNSKVEIYSGDASGNNTSGTVMGIYDASKDEVVYFGSTNCGSDD